MASSLVNVRRHCDFYVSILLTFVVLSGTLTLWPRQGEPWPEGSTAVIYHPSFNVSLAGLALPEDPAIRQRLGLNSTTYINEKDITETEFVFVTAPSNTQEMLELKKTIHSIQKYRPQNVIYVYDLGMSERQQDEVKSMCQVRYRRFNFHIYPRHVGILMYKAWKPIIIADLFKLHGGVFWVDPAVALTTGNFQPLLQQVKESQGGLMLVSANQSNFAVTHKDMYKYLPADLTNMKRHRQGGAAVILFRTRAMVTQVLRWFVLCALRQDCIAPSKGRPCGPSTLHHKTENSSCHHFDQSALNILLINSLNSDLPRHISRQSIVTTRTNGTTNVELRKCVQGPKVQ